MDVIVGKRFGDSVGEMTGPELKRADVQLLVDEKIALMLPEPEPWPPNAPDPKNPSLDTRRR